MPLFALPSLDAVLGKRLITFALRRGLSALGLLLIERGVVDPSDWLQLSAALLPVAADLLWSLYDKAQADKKLADAKEQ